MFDFQWSDKEKKVARQAFDKALGRELTAVLAKLKTMAAAAQEPEDIWAVEDYLTRQRKAIDGKYDYRYSRLILVFARLLKEKWIAEEDLDGLGEEKLEQIKHFASR